MVMFQQDDIDSFQDMLWDPDQPKEAKVGLMGTKLDLPPPRKPFEPPPRPIKPIINRPGARPSGEATPAQSQEDAALLSQEQQKQEVIPGQSGTPDLGTPSAYSLLGADRAAPQVSWLVW